MCLVLYSEIPPKICVMSVNWKLKTFNTLQNDVQLNFKYEEIILIHLCRLKLGNYCMKSVTIVILN